MKKLLLFSMFLTALPLCAKKPVEVVSVQEAVQKAKDDIKIIKSKAALAFMVSIFALYNVVRQSSLFRPIDQRILCLSSVAMNVFYYQVIQYEARKGLIDCFEKNEKPIKKETLIAS